MADDESTHDALPLRTVSKLTGLTPDIIRAWEKRYAVVSPRRGPRGARLYNAADVARLRLLRRVTASGRAIGDIAQLSTPELERLDQGTLKVAAPQAAHSRNQATPQFVERTIEALQEFDAVAVDRALADALVAYGTREFVLQLAAPLLEEVGERWSDGRLSIADEHLLSAMLRNLLTAVMRSRRQIEGPTVLFATPTGERHEFGLLLAALMVADAGLRLCYLGTDLPAAEITAAARRAGASVVGLGLVNSDNQIGALAEVRRIERELPQSTELWLGGRDAAALAGRIGPSRALVLVHMEALEHELSRVRAQPPRRG